VKSDSPSGKPERVTWSTTTAAGRIWTVWIHNNGQSEESGAMEVGITTTEAVNTQPPPSPCLRAARGEIPRRTWPWVRWRGTRSRSAPSTSTAAAATFRDPYQNDLGEWVRTRRPAAPRCRPSPTCTGTASRSSSSRPRTRRSSTPVRW
jgi:hypothetical protein